MVDLFILSITVLVALLTTGIYYYTLDKNPTIIRKVLMSIGVFAAINIGTFLVCMIYAKFMYPAGLAAVAFVMIITYNTFIGNVIGLLIACIIYTLKYYKIGRR